MDERQGSRAAGLRGRSEEVRGGPGAPVVVSVRDVSKRFTIRKDNSLKERVVTFGRAGRRHSEDFWALQGVDLEIPAGSTVGLIGPNGSGKSTLLKMIGGILEPTTGVVERRGRLAALIELGAGMHPDLTGRENVYLNASVLGIPRDEVDARFEAILQFSGIGDFIDTQVKFYSSGMYVRLAFAVAINTDPDVLLVDEVLAVGDEQFQKKCIDKIKEFQAQGRTIVLVSHSLGQVQELCDTAVVLHHGEVKYHGPAREAVQNFREILEGRRLAEAEAEDPDQDPTPGRVTDVDVRVPGREPQEIVRPGDPLRITVRYEHATPLDRWNAGFLIENSLGNLVYGTDTGRVEKVLSPLDGSATLRFDLDAVVFGNGPHFVHAFLSDERGEYIALRRDAARFVMEDDPTHLGTHRIPTLISEDHTA